MANKIQILLLLLLLQLKQQSLEWSLNWLDRKKFVRPRVKSRAKYAMVFQQGISSKMLLLNIQLLSSHSDSKNS